MIDEVLILEKIIESHHGTIFLQNYVGDPVRRRAFAEALLDQVVIPLREITQNKANRDQLELDFQ